jgi:hypothetical protein
MILPARIAAAAKGAAKDAARGAAFAAIAAALSYAIAIWGFGRAYYLGVLIPLALVLFVLIAWLVHLSGGGFLKTSRRGEAEPPQGPQAAIERDSIFAPRDDRIVPRGGQAPKREKSERERAEAPRAAIRGLLWGAAWLGLLAACLYRFAGIGASYYLR